MKYCRPWHRYCFHRQYCLNCPYVRWVGSNNESKVAKMNIFGHFFVILLPKNVQKCTYRLVWYDEECERIFGGRVGWSKKRAGFVVATGRLGCISWTKESEGRGWWIQAVWWTFEWFLCIRATLKIRFTFCVLFGLNKWIKKDNAYLFIW